MANADGRPRAGSAYGGGRGLRRECAGRAGSQGERFSDADAGGASELVFRLTVTDDGGAAGSDEVKVRSCHRFRPGTTMIPSLIGTIWSRSGGALVGE